MQRALDVDHDPSTALVRARQQEQTARVQDDQADVQAWVKQRRKAQPCADLPADASHIWGLALSGGGIRSAVFCFGLVRALARHGALPRFDVLSTVSGGGYIGSALGKLFHDAGSREEVKQVYAALEGADRNWFTWWLRANGRYLIPRGFKDTLFALASHLRNLIGVHIELGVLALVLAIGLAFFNILVWSGLAALPGAQDVLRAMPYAMHWLPTLWLSLLPLALLVITLMAAYWTLPEPGAKGVLRPAMYLAMSVAALIALLLVRPPLTSFDRISALWSVALLVALGWGLAVPLARHALARARARYAPGTALAPADPQRADALAHEDARHHLTSQLGRLGRAAAVLLGLGVLDRLAWYLAFEVQALEWLAGVVVVLTVLLRALLPRLVSSSSSARPALGLGLAALGNLAGYAMLTSLALLWLMAFDKLLFVENASREIYAWSDLGVASVVFIALLGYAWFTRHDFGFLNLSSLHNFYRARITRGFLGAANGWRFPGSGQGSMPPHLRALDAVAGEADDEFKPLHVISVHGRDDVPMAQYQPQRHGGPVHLINVCVNQTSDPRGGLFNQDRRGLPMELGPQAHVRVSGSAWRRAESQGALTLGRWGAISGAAFAPGLGSLTRGGVAALCTLAGLRLGYWWPSHCLAGATAAPARREGKSSGLLRELVGNFTAQRGGAWYLSDGGHYENTAALALLAERASLIVLADCGADPRYRFEDLENLVRKARIDFEAEIEFLRPKTNQPDTAFAYFGSLDDLASPASQACLALARMRYTGLKEPGYLVLVKPNLSAGMTADLVNFKRDHPDFPQETTTDQFFGEAQWESYFKLGRIIGRHLDAALLHKLAASANERFEDDLGTRAQRVAGEDAEANDANPAGDAKVASRLPARIAGTALAASVGLGAAATLGVTLWQGIEGWRVQREAAAKVEQAALTELTTRYLAWEGQKPEAFTPLVATLLRASDHGACRGAEAGWIHDSQLAQCAVQSVRDACGSPAGAQHFGCRLLETTKAIDCLKQVLPSPVHYWGFEFRDPARPNLAACPVLVPAGADAAAAAASAAGVEVAPARPAPPGAVMAVPTPAGAAAESASPAPASPGAGRPCEGKTVHVQIFGGQQRASLRALREPWRQLGATVPRTEDVLDSAQRKDQTPPRAGTDETRTYFHDAGSQACALELVKAARAAPGDLPRWADPVPLPPRLRPTPGVIEVWVAPGANPNQSAAR